MSLTQYNKKRAFNKTPEPKGEKTRAEKNTSPLRFVVQKHDARNLHYDFRLELDGVLKSWAVPKGPSLDPKDKRLAMMTEDHPLSYATFEGEIPEGQYGAGDVIVWDYGVYQSDETKDVEESRKKIKQGLHTGELSFVLLGTKLQGKFTLIKMKERGENAWLLIKAKDMYAKTTDVTRNTASVLSDRVLPQDQKQKRIVPKQKPKKRGSDPMPRNIKPMLAKLVDAPFDKKGWLYEIKWDGYRAVAEVSKNNVKLYSRNGKSFTETYKPIVDVLKKIPHECVFDGEIVAMKNGTPDFHTLQRYKDTPVPLTYVVFDLLYINGRDLRNAPLRERKKLLEEIVVDCELYYSEYTEHKGKDFFAFVTKEGVEGMIAKDGDSSYKEGTRSDLWLKVKTYKEQEAIIIGYTKPRGSRKLMGALVLGAYEGDTIKYIGHSGGGFTDAELKDLHSQLKKIITTPPVKEKVPINSPITWVKPQYVCQIKFSEWTASGRMRHPIYAGLRIDKEPGEVVRETPEKAEIKASSKKSKKKESFRPTNTEKVFWPEEQYTKGDVIAYYEAMADTLLPYLKDRPQNLNRHPNGIEGKNFFQKNITADLPSFVETQKIWSESNNAFINYIVCNNKETLLYLANLGCIELNPWNSRVQNLNKPDYMILDLDPNGRSFDDLITVAKEVRKVLDMACEIHFPKTSGKTGLHIVVPFGARYDYDVARNFAELLMYIVYRRMPHMTSLERSPQKRGGKIYLDYLQNRFGQTLACAYSLRPYPGATVSTPLEWSEVRKGLDPSKFTIKTIHKRLEKKGDLWKSVLSKGNDMRDAIRCLEEENAI